MNQQAFADFLLDEGVFQVGDFTLKSGQKSPFFLNFGDLCSGRQLRLLGQFFAAALERLNPSPSLIFGPAYKGIPLAVATAQCGPPDLAYFSFRKELKSHGEVSPLLGQSPRAGDRIVLIDDVLTTSQTKLEALAQLQEYAEQRSLTLEWSGVLVGVDRQGKTPQGISWAESFTQQTGVAVHSLLKLEDLLNRAEQRGLNVEACRR
jgi:orotate phosphoribosyltransferase